MSKEHLVIIGGVAAGLSAAMEARRAAPELEITVLEKSGDISYGACGLPYVISGLIPSLEQLIAHTPDYFRERHRINILLNSEALEILPSKFVVRHAVEGAQRETGYTNLVIATGASAICPPLPGHELEGVFVLRHLRDGRRVMEFMERARPRAAVVVGAGYIGLEMAEAFSTRGLSTTLIESSDNVMSTLGGRARDLVVEEMRACGIEIIFGEKVSAFEGHADGRIARVLTETGRTVEADIVSIGVGVRPSTELAERAGLEIGASGAISTDERQRASAPGIYAAGDCCEVLHRVSGLRVWHP
ncbi:MAG: FAD-dependent oxidoreductase, partial [Pyrinomonadaceae bacterium]